MALTKGHLMKRFFWLFLLISALGAGTIGVVYGSFSNTPKAAWLRVRYLIRDGLDLEKRWVDLPDVTQASGFGPVDCPPPERTIVIVTGGQSNGANTNASLSKTPIPEEASVWFSGRCFPASDPVLGATGNGGSLWPELGAAISRSLDRPVLFINGAVGGSQIGDWVDTRSGYYDALVGRVSEAHDSGYVPQLIMWHQGETDAAVERDMERVEHRFGVLADMLHADLPEASIYLFRASKCIGNGRENGVQGITDAQTRAAEQRDWVVPGMNTDELGNDFRWDTCHFNSLARSEILKRVIPEISALLQR